MSTGWRTFSIREGVHFQMDPADINANRVISHSPEVTKALLNGDGAFLQKAAKTKAKARKKAKRQERPAKSTQPSLIKSISSVLEDCDPAQRVTAAAALARLRTEQDFPGIAPGSPSITDPAGRKAALGLLRSDNPATRESAWNYLHSSGPAGPHG
jgi:hypothetical protein